MKTGGVPGCKNQNRWSPRVYKSKHVESQSVQIKTGGVPGCTTMRNSEIKNNPRSPQTTSSYMMMYVYCRGSSVFILLCTTLRQTQGLRRLHYSHTYKFFIQSSWVFLSSFIMRRSKSKLLENLGGNKRKAADSLSCG